MNIPAALKALADVGVTSRVVAADLNLSPATVARWAKGRQRPSPRNFTALRGMVDRLLEETLAGDTLFDLQRGESMRQASLALYTDAENTQADGLAERMRRFLAVADVDAIYRAATRLDPVAQRCEVDEADHLHAAFKPQRELVAA